MPPTDDTPQADGEGVGWNAENRCFAVLIGRAQAGSVEAFEELYDRSARWLLARVRRIVRDQGAEDVLAEVYIQVWRSLASYDALRGEPAAWLSTIARSRALDHLRRERRHGDTLPPTPEDAIADDGDGPEQLLWRAQQGRMVRESLALAPLSERERLVLKLAYYSDQTHQEIAQQTGLPLGTVKTLIHRAQKKLGAQVLAPAGATGLRGAAAAGDTIAP